MNVTRSQNMVEKVIGGKGQKVSLVAVAMLLVGQGQKLLSEGEHVIGAGLILSAGVLLLAYEVINEIEFKSK